MSRIDSSALVGYTHLVSKRLQVILGDSEMEEIQQVARRERMSVAEWVRQALRAARLRRPVVDIERRIQVIRAATRHSFPTADIDDMLTQIESGYRQDPTR